MEIELIQPVRGGMIYEDYIRRHGEGLHHIKEKIPDDRIAQVVQNYAVRDVKVTQTGQFVADFYFYLDPEPKLDFVYELGTVLLVSPMPPEFMDVISVQDTPSGLKSAHSTRKSQGASSRQTRLHRRSIASTPAGTAAPTKRQVAGERF